MDQKVDVDGVTSQILQVLSWLMHLRTGIWSYSAWAALYAGLPDRPYF